MTEVVAHISAPAEQLDVTEVVVHIVAPPEQPGVTEVVPHIAAPTEQLRVLVADDHAPTRDDVRRALTDGGLVVCAEAADAAHAVKKALETRPDICLLDVRMPGGGVAAAWEIAARLPTTKVVMLTVSDEDGDLFRALRAGAVSYLLKDIDLATLPAALHDVAEGRAAIPPALVARMVMQFHSSDPRFRTTEISTDFGPRLTSREWDVLAGLAEGLSTRDIAKRLQLKPSGVRAHISAVVQKLGVENREQAVELFRGATDL